MKSNKGFTLIELIVVIVILGILAATALPRFIDFKGDAAQAAVDGVAGGLASASSINYAGKVMSKTVNPTSLNGNATAVCTTANLGALLTAGWPTNYTVAPVAGTCASGESVTCTITEGSGAAKTAAAVITCY